MANLKSITELPVAESADGLNLIVNENGAAKQIAASAVGAQADFAVTDETSPAFIKNKPEVVQSDWEVEDSSNPAFIKNKPFYDTRKFETITLTFDGDLTGKEFVQMADDGGYVKLSDNVYPSEEFIGGILKTTAPDGVQTLEITEEMIMTMDGITGVMPDGSDGMPAFMIIPQELITDDMPFTSAGMWAMCGLVDGVPVFYPSEISWNSVISGELKTVDPKYIKDMYYTTPHNNVEILAETTQIPDEEGCIFLQEPMELLVENGMYTVNWNGVEYLCQCLKDGEELILESELFTIGYHPDMSMEGLSAIINVLDGSTSVTLSIVGSYEEVKKIDMKYMPYEVYDGINELYNMIDDVRNVANNKMDKTNPVGTGSFSMNRKSGTTIGDYSHAEGLYVEASGERSHAEGGSTTASGYASHAEGAGTIASGDYSHAEGYDSIASGGRSHAEGYTTTASSLNSHAEGSNTTASGEQSHAEGYKTTASGWTSHAEGENTTASGSNSHAEGYYTTASGDYSHAEGYYTIAKTKKQHVQGEYNILDKIGSTTTRGKYAHIVGNGTSDTERSNAHTLDWDGNAWYQGTIEGTGFILASPNGTKYKITVADDGTLSAVAV